MGPRQTGDVDDLTALALDAGRGDEKALDEVIRRTQADVWQLCSVLGNAATADDLTQETYLRAIPAMARFRGESSVRTWLLGIARRVAADAIRKRDRSDRAVRRHGPSPTTQQGSAGLVDLRESLDALGPDRRIAFLLTQELGLSYQECADVLGCAVGTVRSRVARARAELVEALAEPTPYSQGGGLQ